MSRILIILAILFSTSHVFGAIITIDFEDDAIPSFSVSGQHNRLEPPYSNNGYGVLANYTSSDFVGFSYGAPGSTLEFQSQDGIFDLLELSMIGAWGSQTATLIGYNDNVVTHSLDVAIDRHSVDHLLLDWANLTSFALVSGTDFIHQPGHSCCGTAASNHIGFDNIIVDMHSFQLPGGDNSQGSGGNGDGGNGNGGGGTGTGGTVSVSEPSTMMLLLLGLAGLCGVRSNRQI